MDLFVILAVIGGGLFLVELLLPTHGVLAVIGAAGLIAAGVVALGDNSSDAADYAGPGLIAAGVLSLGAFAVIGRKVLRAHDTPVQTGREELIGREAEARSLLNPDGQVFADGALWQARLADGAGPLEPGNRVKVESVEGLTLIVRPLSGGG